MSNGRKPVTFVDTVESLGKAAAERGLERRKEVKAVVGPRKLGEQRVTPDQKAMLHLPLWEGPGQAADFDEQGQPLGRAYWLELYEKLGASGMLEHDREMRRLRQNKGSGEQYWTPLQREQVADWQARGLHSGAPRPPRAEEESSQRVLRPQAPRTALPMTAERTLDSSTPSDLTKAPLPIAGSEVA